MRLSSVPAAKFTWDDWQATWGLPSETVGVERFNERYAVDIASGKCIVLDYMPPYDGAHRLFEPKQLKVLYSCLYVVRFIMVDGHGYHTTRKMPLFKAWLHHPLRRTKI